MVLLAGVRRTPDGTALVVRHGSPVAARGIWSRSEVINHKLKDGEIDDDDCFKVALASRHSGSPGRFVFIPSTEYPHDPS